MSQPPNERRPVKRAAAAVLLTTLLTTGSLVIVTRGDSAPKPGVVAIGKPAMYDSRCGDAYRAVRFYRQKYDQHRALLGYTLAPALEEAMGCKRLRERAAYWIHAAKVNRVAANKHFNYHHAWQTWLPDKWQRVGACETGYGQRPGRWDWNSGTYQGAFGFYHGSWDAFVPRADPKAGPYPSEAYEATPRQQYEVALAIWRAYGFSGWGCRGA